MNKTQRLRRAKKTRKKIDTLGGHRLTVLRSNVHTSVQLILKTTDGESKVIASASTNDPEIKKTIKGTKCEQASIIGAAIASKAKEAGVTEVSFDRSGYHYHGRIKALADGAREAGLDF